MDRKELQEQIKQALKSHDKVRLMTLRSVLGEVKNLEIDARAEATEQQVNDMVKRVLKQARETLEGYEKVNDADHTAEYRQRVQILEDCLPEQLCGTALEELVKQVVEQTGATTRRDMGKVMGALVKQTGGNFDKAAAARMASALLG